VFFEWELLVAGVKRDVHLWWSFLEGFREEEKPEGSSWIFWGTFGARTVRNPSHFAGEEHFQV